MGFQDIGLRVVLLGVREFDSNAKNIEKNIDQMNRSMDKTGASADKASRGIDGVSTKTDKASRSFKDAGSATEGFATKLSTLGSRVTTLGVALTAGLTVPLNLVRNQLIGAGIEFEDAFSNVGKTVDGIVNDLGRLTPEGEKFRKSLVDLSLELPITVNELSAVAAAAGQVGVPFGKSGEVLLEFTQIAASMGVATNITAEESAIAMARVANIYGIAAGDMIEFSRGFSSSIVALGNTTAATEQEILNMTLRLAPAANLAGIAADETLALAASMTEMGIQAEAGGTALSTILLTMSEAAKSANGPYAQFNENVESLAPRLDKLRQVLKSGVSDFTELEFILRGTGLNLEGVSGMMSKLAAGTLDVDDIVQHVSQNTLMDMEDALDKASGKTALLADIMGVSEQQFADAFGAKPLETLQRFLMQLADLQDAGQISEETLTELGFSGIRVRSIINTLGPNMENLTGNVELANDAWVKQTALQVEVQKKFATTKAQIQLMKNAITALGIAVFDYVKPSFDAAIKSTTELINKFREFFTASDKNADMISKLFIAASLLGPALIAVGVALKSIALISKSLGVSNIFSPLLAIATNPVVAGGLLVIGAAFLAIKKNVFGLGDLFNQVASSISNIVNLFSMFFTQGSISDPLKNMFKSIMSGDMEGAVGHFKEAWEELVWWVNTILVPALTIEFYKIKIMVMDSIRDAASWLSTDGVALFFGFIDYVVNKIGKYAPIVYNKLQEWGKALISWIVPFISPLLTKLGNLSAKVFDWIATTAPKIFDKLKVWGKAFIDWAATDGINAIINTFSMLFSTIGGMDIDVKSIVLKLVEATGVVFGALTTVIIGAVKFLIEQVGPVLQEIDWGNVLKSVGTFLEDVAKSFGVGFINGIKAVMGEEQFNNLIDSVLGWFSKSANAHMDDMEKVGSAILSGVWSGIKWAWNNVLKPGIESTINFIIGGAKELLGMASPSTVFYDIGIDILQGLWDGIKSLVVSFMSWIGEKAQQLLDIFVNKLGDIYQFGIDTIQNIWDGIKSLWESFIADVETKVLWFVNTFKNTLSSILQFGKDVLIKIQEGIVFGWTIFIAFVQEKADAIKSIFTNLANSMVDIGKSIVDGIKSGIEGAWGEFSNWFDDKIGGGLLGDAWDAIKGGSPAELYVPIGESILEGIQKGMDIASTSLLDTFSGLNTTMVVNASEKAMTIPQTMTSAALGTTVTNTNYTTSSNVSNTTFAPTVNGVPMQDEHSAGREIVNAWRTAQIVGGL